MTPAELQSMYRIVCDRLVTVTVERERARSIAVRLEQDGAEMERLLSGVCWGIAEYGSRALVDSPAYQGALAFIGRAAL